MSFATLKVNLFKAHRNRETISVGGGLFEPHEIRKALEDIQLLIDSASRLVGHTLQYASMPHAHSDAHRDAANALAAIKRLESP